MRSSQIQDAGAIQRLALTTANFTVFQALNPKQGAPSAAAILAVPGTNRLTARLMEITASGLVYNAGAATTIALAMAFGTDTNSANNSGFATTGAVNIAGTTAIPYYLQARLIYDNVSGLVCGDFSAIVGPAIVPRATLANTLAGVNGINEPVFNMVFGAQFGAANAGNYAICDTFAIEA